MVRPGPETSLRNDPGRGSKWNTGGPGRPDSPGGGPALSSHGEGYCAVAIAELSIPRGDFRFCPGPGRRRCPGAIHRHQHRGGRNGGQAGRPSGPVAVRSRSFDPHHGRFTAGGRSGRVAQALPTGSPGQWAEGIRGGHGVFPRFLLRGLQPGQPVCAAG